MLGTWGFNMKVQQNAGFSTTHFINRDHHQQDAEKNIQFWSQQGGYRIFWPRFDEKMIRLNLNHWI
jgi:hypothetical protein